ncbi:uncharacterized protein JCM6883_002992 [Sporobolomyces salmoneus]|uniref:uncharacterized protein n=1 Tax=Sporobolomyces salmoneus TaxID=183962 RepID=UPI00316FE60C
MPPRPRASTSASTLPDLSIDAAEQEQLPGSSSTSRGNSRAASITGGGGGASGADSTGSKPAKKKSQRPSWSCTECTRRKIRCDRVVPGCNQCIKRGKVHLCRLDQDVDLGLGVEPPPHLTPNTSNATASLDPSTLPNQPRLATFAEYDAITRSVNVVRQRLSHLERVMRAFTPQNGLYDENGNPLYGIDMNRLASQQDLLPSTSTNLPIPPRQNSFPANGEEYEPKSHYRVGGMNGAEPYPLPSQQPLIQAHERVRDMDDRDRRMTESDGEVEAAVTLEFLALGRDRKEDHFHRAELRRPDEDDEEPTSPALVPNPSLPTDQALSTDSSSSKTPASPYRVPQPSLAQTPLDSLPSPSLSEFIINYSLDRVCWQHNAVHVGQFRAEHSEFLSWGEKRGELVNQAWIALYFALLCVGVKYMTEEDAREGGISNEDRSRLPKIYFDSAMASLNRAHFLSKHSIYTVQTCVVMVMSCSEVGGSDLIATLLACGIRIAQHLNIHRFASDQEWESRRRANGIDPKSQEGIKGLIQRELRKRLWYTLTTEDWFCIPFRRAYTIFPTHFTTPLPLNCHDSDLSAGNLVQRSQDEPTIVSKIIATYTVAACIRRYFEHVFSSASQGKSASYELCLEVDREIRKAIEDGPKFLKVEDPNSEEWIKHLRHYFVISISHKLLICHRVFLGRSFRDPRFAYSRKAAIEAARSVIQEIARSDTHYQPLWTLPFHTIAASTSLILDIFQSSSTDPDIPNKRKEVECALQNLQKLSEEGSKIATRGVQLLSALLAEEAKHRRPVLPTSSESRKRRASGSAPGDGERFGAVAKRVVSNSRTSLNGSPSASLQGSPSFQSSTFPYFAPTLPSGGGGIGFEHHQSPADSHQSDGLNQDAFDVILQGLNVGAYGAGSVDLGASGGEDEGGSGIPGEIATAEFWRNFDSTFEPGALEMLGEMADAGIGFDGFSVGGEGVATPKSGGDSALGFTTTPW